MEGKALLFKNFAGVDGFPICIDVGGPTHRCRTASTRSSRPSSASPRCSAASTSRTSRRRRASRSRIACDASLDIPVFHDDQHGTAVVTLAALENSLKIVGKKMEDVRVVIAGAGAAGVAIAKILMNAGVTNIVACDRRAPSTGAAPTSTS
jgi:malate dehydrogenase (oxaloacetate-decarboxylating)